jgi:hypothetical protein
VIELDREWEIEGRLVEARDMRSGSVVWAVVGVLGKTEVRFNSRIGTLSPLTNPFGVPIPFGVGVASPLPETPEGV